MSVVNKFIYKVLSHLGINLEINQQINEINFLRSRTTKTKFVSYD